MKKFGICLITFFLLSINNIYGIVKENYKKIEGHIIMNDGTEYRGYIKMPKLYTKWLQITLHDNNEMIEVPSQEVKELDVWRPIHPDKVHRFVYRPYKAKDLFSGMKEKALKPIWMCMEALGDNVIFFSSGYYYYLYMDGTLEITSAKGTINLYGLKPGKTDVTLIGPIKFGTKRLRKALMKFLADDPALCTKLKEKEIKPSEWNIIADQYHPVR
ncbi:MAG: hypothetical protein IJ604_12540 [Prevotella sp.]|nr:hypothetical protein [Prevotella sp.]MBR1464183.1 hypothetical protein [Prevotella sp.]